MKRTHKAIGYVIYRGASLLDGAPIVAVAITGRKSKNIKTGAMVQTYILRADMSPLAAIHTGADVSICGTCPHRGALPVPAGASMPPDRTCYVNVGQGAEQVHRALMRAAYTPDFGALQAADACAGRAVRLGTYGDPAAVPAYVWQRITARATMRTGYTHAWRHPAIDIAQRDAIGALCMASADSATDAIAARAAGLRPFRVRAADEPMLAREFVCPASAEAGKRKLCAECGACDGAARGTGKASPVIIAHGFLASRFRAAGVRT